MVQISWLHSVRILIVSLVQDFVDLVRALVVHVQAYVDLVQALVTLVQAHDDLVQALVTLVQAHPPQGGLISVARRQVVVGPGYGLVGAVWWVVFVRGVNWLHWHLLCTRDTTVGVDAWIYSSFSKLKLPAPSSWGKFEAGFRIHFILMRIRILVSV